MDLSGDGSFLTLTIPAQSGVLQAAPPKYPPPLPTWAREGLAIINTNDCRGLQISFMLSPPQSYSPLRRQSELLRSHIITYVNSSRLPTTLQNQAWILRVQAPSCPWLPLCIIHTPLSQGSLALKLPWPSFGSSDGPSSFHQGPLLVCSFCLERRLPLVP